MELIEQPVVIDHKPLRRLKLACHQAYSSHCQVFLLCICHYPLYLATFEFAICLQHKVENLYQGIVQRFQQASQKRQLYAILFFLFALQNLYLSKILRLQLKVSQPLYLLCIAHFRLLPQISHQNYFIYSSSHNYLL